MKYFEPVFRPPSEADSLILQVTVGCSHNACVFCAMYRNKRFFVRPLEEVLAEVDEAAAEWPGCPRVFLGDGDAMAAPTDHLLAVMTGLSSRFRSLRRVSCYATPMNLLAKPAEDLALLKAAGLSLFYLGLESGSDRVLREMAKGASADEIVEGVGRASRAGLRSSLMVLLGLGGIEGSEEHAAATAKVLNRIQPHYLSALTWYPAPGAPLFNRMKSGRFVCPDDSGVLRELKVLVSELKLQDTVFRANHASNPLPIGGRLSRDRDRLLAVITAAERGTVPLRPAFLRGT